MRSTLWPFSPKYSVNVQKYRSSNFSNERACELSAMRTPSTGIPFKRCRKVFGWGNSWPWMHFSSTHLPSKNFRHGSPKIFAIFLFSWLSNKSDNLSGTSDFSISLKSLFVEEEISLNWTTFSFGMTIDFVRRSSVIFGRLRCDSWQLLLMRFDWGTECGSVNSVLSRSRLNKFGKQRELNCAFRLQFVNKGFRLPSFTVANGFFDFGFGNQNVFDEFGVFFIDANA